MEFSNIQLDAFRPSNLTLANYQTPSPCPANPDAPNDLIPIIVGCVLAAMVVVVLVAYLVGRKYRESKNYEQMD